jgi:large subunit ribosomal protein L15
MKLHELSPAKGSRKTRKRIGRGHGAGQGKTSGRGQKGQGSRSSVGLPTGFEGGQMPLKQRLPKLRGFHNRWRKEFVVVNLGKLGRFEKGSVIDADVLTDAGLIPRASSPIKVLAAGQLKHALTLRVDRISAAARTAVEAAGGSVELVGPQPESEIVTRGRAAARATKQAAKADAADARATAAENAPAAEAPSRRTKKAETKAKAGKTSGTTSQQVAEVAATSDPEPDGAPDNEAETEDSE